MTPDAVLKLFKITIRYVISNISIYQSMEKQINCKPNCRAPRHSTSQCNLLQLSLLTYYTNYYQTEILPVNSDEIVSNSICDRFFR